MVILARSIFISSSPSPLFDPIVVCGTHIVCFLDFLETFVDTLSESCEMISEVREIYVLRKEVS